MSSSSISNTSSGKKSNRYQKHRKNMIRYIIIAAAVIFFVASLVGESGREALSRRLNEMGPRTRPRATEESKTDMPGKPSIAHFYAFPQSGATHFMYLLQHSTGKTTAINYGHVTMDMDSGAVAPLSTDSQRLYGNRGPTLLSPNLDIPENYILTRTQGDGFCLGCYPSQYVSNLRNFAINAFSGTVKTDGKILGMRYEPKDVKKAIHLYQSPFDNVVARFRSVRARNTSLQRKYWLSLYGDNLEGLMRWCGDLDKNYFRNDSKKYPPNVFRDMTANGGVPCRQEFFKYVQWHNHATQLIEKLQLDSPVKIVHYKDFVADRTETLKGIADYLEQDFINPPLESPLENLKTSDYYRQEHVDRISAYFEKYADPGVWEETKQYMTLS